MDSALVEIYQGEGLPVFAGQMRQGGGGFLGNLFKAALPFLKTAGKHALNVASATAQDALEDKPIGKSLVRNTFNEINKIGKNRKRFNTVNHEQKPKRGRKTY